MLVPRATSRNEIKSLAHKVYFTLGRWALGAFAFPYCYWLVISIEIELRLYRLSGGMTITGFNCMAVEY